jgi:hypothetical protein
MDMLLATLTRVPSHILPERRRHVLSRGNDGLPILFAPAILSCRRFCRVFYSDSDSAGGGAEVFFRVPVLIHCPKAGMN